MEDLCSFDIYFHILFWMFNLDIVLRPQHVELRHFRRRYMLCVICNTNNFNSFCTKTNIRTSLIKIPWQVCVCGGGGGQSPLMDMSIYIQYFGDAGSEQSLVCSYKISYISVAYCPRVPIMVPN